jgi:hypothetical protein
MGDSAVTRHLRRGSFPDSSEIPPEEPEIGGSDPIDDAIFQVLDEQPFVSLRELAKPILIPMMMITAIRYHFVNKMSYKLKHCKCVPHRPSAAQRQTRVSALARVVDLLRSVQLRGWQ